MWEFLEMDIWINWRKIVTRLQEWLRNGFKWPGKGGWAVIGETCDAAHNFALAKSVWGAFPLTYSIQFWPTLFSTQYTSDRQIVIVVDRGSNAPLNGIGGVNKEMALTISQYSKTDQIRENHREPLTFSWTLFAILLFCFIKGGKKVGGVYSKHFTR
jgi:hypothetical protein